MNHEERHLVSNVVGSAEMHIEVGPVLPLSRRDTVILASDGLTDNLHTGELIDTIHKGPLRRVMRRLAEKTSQRMTNPTPDHPSKMDDVTFIVYRPAARR
jgi:serine/threonine protein phosphatase PrpC